MTHSKQISVVVSESHQGIRLDKFLAEIPEIHSRSRAQYLIDSGLVKVNGKPAKSSLPLKTFMTVEVSIPLTPVSTELVPLQMALDIIFEDDDLIVVNKPSGLVVHPSVGHEQDTLVNALLSHTKKLSMKFNEMRPGIVHRIDKETSGLLVIAKNDVVHEKLSQQFKDRTTQRKYEALCLGSITPPMGKIQSFISRHPTDRKRFASSTDGNGKQAISHYKVLSSNQGLSFVEMKLETGRTHQIRVHLSEKGYPLVGDKLYNFQRKMNLVRSSDIQSHIRQLNRFMLHAKDLGFTHPISQEEMFFTVEWPKPELEWLQKLGFKK